MVEFSGIKKTLSIQEINTIEQFVELHFPQEYKEHLLKFNGGKRFPNVFTFNENGKITSSCIDYFLAIYDGEYDNLRTYIEIYKIEQKRLPTHILPIANDPGGNLICISCDSNDLGAVYFWDHENEVDYQVFDDNNYSNLFLIAKSFDDFLKQLREDI